MSYPRRPLSERFWRNVDKSGSCWLWTAGRFGRGYGAFKWIDGRTIQAHRAAWLIERGPIPEGLFVCHTCDVKLCVRPDHLFTGTNSENQLDASAKGILRGHPGDEHPMRKISSAIARAMRDRFSRGETTRELADAYGVHVKHAWRVVTKEIWKEA